MTTATFKCEHCGHSNRKHMRYLGARKRYDSCLVTDCACTQIGRTPEEVARPVAELERLEAEVQP